MKKTRWLSAGISAVAIASMWGGPAQALTVPTTADLTTSLAAGRFTGVGSIGSVNLSGGASHSCTGALVSANVVLTAAHCIGGTDSGNARFFLPAAGDYNLSGGGAFTITGSLALTSYTGFGTADIALMTLSRRVSGHTIYDLYTDRDELGQEITMVGAGLSGTMDRGATLEEFDQRLRAGKNRYDLLGTAFGYGEDIVAMDNDNGLAVNDVFGRFFGVSDLGVFESGQLAEAGLIYGDSGGPDFIGGKISGVHSFAGSGMYFDPAVGAPIGCGLPGSVDAAVAGPLGDCSDGSFGDLAGSVRVSFYADAIRSYIAAAAVGSVPEPDTWTMMIAGFGLTGIGLRRRRPIVAATPA